MFLVDIAIYVNCRVRSTLILSLLRFGLLSSSCLLKIDRSVQSEGVGETSMMPIDCSPCVANLQGVCLQMRSGLVYRISGQLMRTFGIQLQAINVSQCGGTVDQSIF